MRIDNPGAGNCGFYAFSIGLIHIIQTEFLKKGTSKAYDIWQQNGLTHVTLRHVLECDLKQLSAKPHTYKTELLNKLQASLRDVFIRSRLEELKTAIETDRLSSSDIHSDFCELVNFYTQNSPSESALHELKFNILALDKSVQQLAKTLASNLNDIGLEEDSLKQDAIDTVVRSSLASTIKSSEEGLPSNYWATAKTLAGLAEVFNVRLNFAGHIVGSEDNRAVLTVKNLGNCHWVTEVPSFPSVKSSASQQAKIASIVKENAREVKDHPQVELYKAHIKELMEAALSKGLFNTVKEKDKIKIDQINNATALLGESDEDFAARLQEAEIRRVLR